MDHLYILMPLVGMALANIGRLLYKLYMNSPAPAFLQQALPARSLLNPEQETALTKKFGPDQTPQPGAYYGNGRNHRG